MDEIERGATAKGVVSASFYNQVAGILEAARGNAYRAVNAAMVAAYWEIGRMIVDEQGGEGRAEYGTALIKELSERLTADFGKGFDERNLRFMRQFHLCFPIRNALRTELTWTHYRALSRVDDSEARAWYMNEAADQGWSSRTLDRNISSQYYYRLLQSQAGKRPAVEAEMRSITEPLQHDKLEFIKNPVVAEFLGLEPNAGFPESQLESAIIASLQKFLLELGKGYAFVARQQHIRVALPTAPPPPRGR